MTAWSDEYVDRGRRIDVGEGVAIVVLVDRGGGNATVNDFAKETTHSIIPFNKFDADFLPRGN